jgi:hypothetical protein
MNDDADSDHGLFSPDLYLNLDFGRSRVGPEKLSGLGMITLKGFGS